MPGLNFYGVEKASMTGDPGAQINLKVKGQDGSEVFFSMKRSSKLRNLMTAYFLRLSPEPYYISFLFHGRLLRGDETPDELEMEDGDEIGANFGQTCYYGEYMHKFGRILNQLIAESIGLKERLKEELTRASNDKELDAVFAKIGEIVLELMVQNTTLKEEVGSLMDEMAKVYGFEDEDEDEDEETIIIGRIIAGFVGWSNKMHSRL